MSAQGPKVSVVMPTYKRDQEYLSRALSSLLNQTYKNIEILLIDDNPVDSEYRRKTIEFMKRYQDDHRVVYHLNEKNVGGALARNKGIDIASGAFITFLDDDDQYLPKKIEHQVKFMLKENCEMSFANLKMVNQAGIFLYKRKHPDLKLFDQDSLLKHHLTKKITGTPTFMYTAEAIRAIGGFDDIKVGQEYILMLKTIEHGLKIRYLHACDVVAYSHDSGGISQGRNKIEGERHLHRLRKQYFDKLTLREKMYVNFRHYAGMAVTYTRNKQYLRAFGNGIAMFLASPLDCVKEVLYYAGGLLRKSKA